MQLWIDQKSYLPTDLLTLRSLSKDRYWLESVCRFLEFWFSKETEWIAQTSGSTSKPKAISLSRQKMEASARMSLHHFGLDPQMDGLVLCLSANQVGGFMILARALLGDLDVWILEPSSLPIPTHSSLLVHKRWFISLVPMQLALFHKSPELQEASRLWKGILIGGAALTTSQEEILKAVRCPVYQSYGMTETVSHIAVRTVHPTQAALKKIPYTALEGIELKTTDNQCLVVRGEITGFDWLYTLDQVLLLSKNSFIFLGRADNRINSGGIKIDPQWVQEVLSASFSLDEDTIVVTSLPHDDWGEKLVAVVKGELAQTALEIDEIFDQLRKTFDSKKLPKAIYSLAYFPLTASQKVDVPAIQQRIADLQPIWPTLYV